MINLFKNFLLHKMRLVTMSILLIVILVINSLFSIVPLQKITFWNVQQKGANVFNSNIAVDDIKKAQEYGIKFIRLAPDKFITVHRDFLIGNCDDYRGLMQDDFEQLKKILDICWQEKMPVVITMLSLPGSRWNQNNNNKDDLRIWNNKEYQLQAALFWRDLASLLQDHPAVIGYNILNEPHPERLFASTQVHIQHVQQAEVQKMLYELYSLIIQHIRAVDTKTPIIIDSSAYADPQTFEFLQPHKDENILYSFHMYEPYEYTNYKMNQGKYRYPGNVHGKEWNRQELWEYMQAVVQFQKKYCIESNRILVGEFGGNRVSEGLEKYFEDLIAIFNKENWHFAFYAFRENTWEGMDYELGNKKLPWSYWQALEQGKAPQLNRQSSHMPFAALLKHYVIK